MEEANLAMELMCKDIGNAGATSNDSSGAPSIFVMPGNTDSTGNYVPSSSGTYTTGTLVQFYLSNWKGTAPTGTTLWRQTGVTTTSGGLLGTGLLGGSTTTWTPDAAWSQAPGGQVGKFPDVSALSFTTTGLPINAVQVSLTVTTKEGGQSSSYTDTRIVYLQNHN